MDRARQNRLRKTYTEILNGRTAISRANSTLFLEALLARDDHAVLIGELTASVNGLKTLHQAMVYTLAASFFNGTARRVLDVLQHRDVQGIDSGNVLNKVILRIVEPFFWDSYLESFKKGELDEEAERCFAWLFSCLVSLRGEEGAKYRSAATDNKLWEKFLSSNHANIREFGNVIKRSTLSSTPVIISTLDFDRHNNDFEDYRKIAILPTGDEINSKDPPFLRTSAALYDDKTEEKRVSLYLDNMFRLLREDMVCDLREELQIALGKKKGHHRGMVITGLKLLDEVYRPSDEKRLSSWGFQLQCQSDLWFFKKVKAESREDFLTTPDGKKHLRHQSLTCLIVDNDIIAFPTIHRDEELLAKKLPVVVLQLLGGASIRFALTRLKTAKQIKLILMDTAVFSYEPVLKAIQDLNQLPLSEELLFWKDGKAIGLVDPPPRAARIVSAIQANHSQDLQHLIGTAKSIKLDHAQASSLVRGLTQQVALIQGPPGTGKSFIGALLARIIHDATDKTILVVCYTNHALDQFLGDLLDIGIPESAMARLGGKSTARTASLSLVNQKKQSNYRIDWQLLDSLKARRSILLGESEKEYRRYHRSGIHHGDIMGYLQFEDEDYFTAFTVPETTDGMTLVGGKGKAVDEFYLLDQWLKGADAGVFKGHQHTQASQHIWEMPKVKREAKKLQWETAMVEEQVDTLTEVALEYNAVHSQVGRKFQEGVAALLASKRVVGCTTTAAAKYVDDLRAVSPGVLLVEEAGEILESHVITALSAQTTQMILIGDHKQLRPKVNNYQLTVEKGEGYDLNRSLFERLVLKGYPHQTLSMQHRMRPEISDIVRQITYPDLTDAPKTQGRPPLRGVEDTIVFIQHSHPEDKGAKATEEQLDLSATSSKRNSFEANMVVKIIRYLAMQGYRTDEMVVLTPYLGQLSLLRGLLQNHNDVVLNDLDSFELVRAGLLSPANASTSKKKLRLATVDNYQGEESDIVVVSMTRSNAQGDIGFMSSPERLNVLVSRARNALIMIGNADTFIRSKKGKVLWSQFINILKDNKHFYGGFPAICETHRDRKSLLSSAEDFEEQCPDGGCSEPCGQLLKCGTHMCPLKCHQLSDHSKMDCKAIEGDKCPVGHRRQWQCHQGIPQVCRECDKEAKAAALKMKKDFERTQRMEEEQREHDRKLEKLNAELHDLAQVDEDLKRAEERANALQQKQQDVESATNRRQKKQTPDPLPPNNPRSPSPLKSPRKSPSNQPGPLIDFSDSSSNISYLSADDSDDTGEGSDKGSSTPPKAFTDPASQPTAATDIIKPMLPSEAAAEWQRQKAFDGARDVSIDKIMKMIGLEEVKKQVLAIKDKIDTTKRQRASLKKDRFNVVFLGNPGTGKTTIARLYSSFLANFEVLPATAFVETTGAELANEGVAGAKKRLTDIKNAGGGAIFIDEAYQLTASHNHGGRAVLDYLLAEMENNVGTIVFILAGYNKEMESFFEHNPGLTSRIPHRFQFRDYEDGELLEMFKQKVIDHYNGQAHFTDGLEGLWSRIVVKRLGRGRGRPGFGNARALENVWSRIRERQASRLANARKRGKRPDDFMFLPEDLIGPDPSKSILQSKAWETLKGLIGLKSIKDTIWNFIDLINLNYKRELEERKPAEYSLNRVFFGNPGTGKTTVAKLYGQILQDLGMLSNGEVIVKNPSDFIGAHLGESEQKTKAILASTMGKVLVIDEAYMLYSGGASGISHTDSFRTAVVDTLVAEVQSVPGDDRCVLLLGYRPKILEMFQNMNEGLSRRFAIEDAFTFEDFTEAELEVILEMKMRNQDLGAAPSAKKVAMEVLSRLRNRPNFGNAGEVENVLGQAKNRYQTRQAAFPPAQRPSDIIFEPQDFDPDWDRHLRAAANLQNIFADIVGCEDVISKLGAYQKVANAMKARKLDARPEIPMAFVFKGPPGTGKTTTARKIGQVFADMGFLSSSEVIECSATDLVGSYIGHTGPKVRKLFEKAVGKVLFVDEAYRLGQGHFSSEAVDEVVTLMTDVSFRYKLVVILAGYDQDMNRLMAANAGLSSRFPEEIIFRNFTPEECMDLLQRKLIAKDIEFDDLSDSSSPEHREIIRYFRDLSSIPSWGNARDVETLAKTIIGRLFAALNSPDDPLILSAKDAVECTRRMLQEKRQRTSNVPGSTHTLLDPFADPDLPPPSSSTPPPPPSVNVGTSTAKNSRNPNNSKGKTKDNKKPPTKEPDATEPPRQQPQDGRDPGVADLVWDQLQLDIKTNADRAKADRKRLDNIQRDLVKAAKREKAAKEEKERLAKEIARDDAAREELKRKREEVRLKALQEMKERERIAKLLQKKKDEEDRKRKEEVQAQQKLRQMGVCVAGFQWIKQPHGYRCAGGTHFVGNNQLNV